MHKQAKQVLNQALTSLVVHKVAHKTVAIASKAQPRT
jgi:hypothetical protein